MPNLTAAIRPSKYVEQAHLVVLVDGIPLDMYLAGILGDPGLEGLVSTLDGCLPDERERECVSRAILPGEGQSLAAPLLVCPDDCDFSCTLVMVEVRRAGDSVVWARFGFARADRRTTCPALDEVDWFQGVEPLGFRLHDYMDFLVRCRELATPWWR